MYYLICRVKTPDNDPHQVKPTVGQKLAKKYPFNRTTTPNSLREHLKETLAKNLDSSSLDETIQCFRDDEILDTFNIDSENVETPPVHRRNGGGGSKHHHQPEPDTGDEVGSMAGERRKKFQNGEPLGDRELARKKQQQLQQNNNNSTTDLVDGGEDFDGECDEPGLFDRFSSARKTLGRGSFRSSSGSSR